MQVPTEANSYFHVSSRNVATPAHGEHPPQYASQNPSSNAVYSFSPVGISSMLLVPRKSPDKDTQAQYCISVRMNCFMPSSYITTIYLGADESGTPVGSFEMGMVAAASCVRIGRVINNTAIALTQSGTWGNWYWHPANINEKYHLRWEFEKRPCICRSANGSRPILARFTPPAVYLGDQLPELEVTQEGHQYLDHILISLLIIERKRLTPGRPETTKEIFN
ncbi:hypothetical protein BDZ97DRAFT_1917621 [Flammula alnicola]|nr:hypothetical protein BDZ97DRAFT_1917621 [Flammula alnicola]